MTSIWSSKSGGAASIRSWCAMCISQVVPLFPGTATTTSVGAGSSRLGSGSRPKLSAAMPSTMLPRTRGGPKPSSPKRRRISCTGGGLGGPAAAETQ